MPLGALMEDSCRCLSLLFFSAGLLATAFSQAGCVLPTRERIAELVQITNGDLIGEEPTATTNLTNFHYTCKALGDRADLFRSLSIAVKYDISGTVWTDTRVSQLLLTCNSGTFDRASPTAVERFINETLVFSIPTRRDCRTCSSDSNILRLDNDANCAREYQATKQPDSYFKIKVLLLFIIIPHTQPALHLVKLWVREPALTQVVQTVVPALGLMECVSKV